MNKKTQFTVAGIVAVSGVILLAVNRFTASASSLTSYAGNFTVITIIGIVLMVAAALWFYKLSIKD